jgi:outer membrane receptor protein involved in Fe transport
VPLSQKAEAEEAALPELQRHMLRRKRAREAAAREDEARQAAAAAEAARRRAAADAQAALNEWAANEELNDSEASGRGARRKSDKIKALQQSIAAASGAAEEQQPGGGRSRRESGGASRGVPQQPVGEGVPTVFIASDDPRLAPFGPVIEYNGRDAFELGAVGSVTALLDAGASSTGKRACLTHP